MRLKPNSSTPAAFEATSKRRKGFPSETRVKRGDRVVRGNKELLEKSFATASLLSTILVRSVRH